MYIFNPLSLYIYDGHTYLIFPTPRLRRNEITFSNTKLLEIARPEDRCGLRQFHLPAVHGLLDQLGRKTNSAVFGVDRKKWGFGQRGRTRTPRVHLPLSHSLFS